MRVKNRFTSVAAAIAVIISIFSLFAGGGAQFASAAASAYTNVMTDLTQDESFNAADYPGNVRDYGINVIQLAESTDGELFIYTYQPSGQQVDLIASTVSIAEQPNNADDLNPELYELELLNSYNVFYKYKVSGYKVSDGKERFYNLIMIQRPYISGVDAPGLDGSVTNRKAYALGQYWYATTDDGGAVNYRMVLVDYVEIINPFTSRIRTNKSSTGSTSTRYFQDNYYIAFSTNRNIEKLLSATVSYRTQDYFYKHNGILGIGGTEFNEHATFSNERPNVKKVNADEAANLQQEGFELFWGLINNNKNFTWQRIQSATDFVNNAGASSSDNEIIQKQGLQWVLMFDEVSAYRYEAYSAVASLVEESGQIIDLVTVLRLEFVENGITYNLGAVSDTVSKDFDFKDDDNTPPSGCNGCNSGGLPWWAWLLIVPALLVVFVLIAKLLVWLVTQPFKRREAAATSTRKPRKTKHTKGSTGKRRRKKGGKRK